MKIQCILLREGGSKVELDGLEYHFEPVADGCHVAIVANDNHADRFLAIPEAFKLYRGEHEPTAKEPLKLRATVITDPTDVRVLPSSPVSVLLGSSVHEATYEIGTNTYQLGDIVNMAFEKSGLTAEEWNELEEEDRHAKIDIVLDDLAEAADKAPEEDKTEPAANEREELAAQYKAKFGKAPHYRLSIDNMKAALAAE